MSPDPCILWAPLIAAVVSFLKRFPFIRRNPKVVVAVVVTAVQVLPWVLKGRTPADVLGLAECLIAQLGLAVGSYEIAKPLLRGLKLDPSKGK